MSDVGPARPEFGWVTLTDPWGLPSGSLCTSPDWAVLRPCGGTAYETVLSAPEHSLLMALGHYTLEHEIAATPTWKSPRGCRRAGTFGEKMPVIHGVPTRTGLWLTMLGQQDPELMGPWPPSHWLVAIWGRPADDCTEKATPMLTCIRSGNSAPC